MNTKLESLKFDNVDDGWNNLRKIKFVVTDYDLGKRGIGTRKLIENKNRKQEECKNSGESIRK